MKSLQHRRDRSATALLRIALWAVLLAVVTYTRTDPDLWGHVRFGLDIVRELGIPHADPYSFTSDREWINHEWAAEAISGGAFYIAGNAGLVLLKVAVIAGVLLLLHSTLRREGLHSPLARDVMAGLAVIITIEQAHHVRPQLFSLLFFTLLLWCLTRATREHRWLIALPPLFAVWANFHGGWIVGGAVLVLWMVGLVLGGARQYAAWCAVAGTASLAATLVTPYGFRLWQFLGETVGFGRSDIREWQPIYALDLNMWILWGATFGLAVLGWLQSRRANVRPERLVVTIALALASLHVSRLLAFFAMAALFLLGEAIASELQRRRPAPSRDRPLAQKAVAAIAICVTAAALSALPVNIARVPIDPRHTPEPGAVEFLRTRNGTGRVLVWFDWGQYAIWHLPPGMKVSIDGRRETVYSAGLQDRHIRFYFDLPGGADLPRELAVDYVWIPQSAPAARRLSTSEGWARLYEGEQSVIFGRSTAKPQSAPMMQATLAAVRRFPGP